ncbi:MAG TPA: thiamine pyrophosphate-dependent enzyme, partial [Candidatus Dormibacteraeota bacterium]|nr:thiamine pyrophosphate-dependent enzyme [Candidatus Dormibacteraeota bacterium]
MLLPRSGVALTRDEVVADYRLAFRSREVSLVIRREVLSGRAKFGISGDGKEVPQLAMARAIRAGDWRAGYYRDQTVMLALGQTTVRKLFAQLYADPDVEHDPESAGRQMNNHFATRLLDEQGRFLDQMARPNTSADLSPVAAWMPRLLGLAYASRLYRFSPALASLGVGFSAGGGEVAFGTIGDASTSEGHFWETLNAACVLQVPMLLAVWDDGYGISVPTELQTAKASISRAAAGFGNGPDGRGIHIEVVRGWDYPALCDAFISTAHRVRSEHAPALVHVIELTQPQGHSTSGSHERYKPPERLAWEREHDCVSRMRDWMLDTGLADGSEVFDWELEERHTVEAERHAALQDLLDPIRVERDEAVRLLTDAGADHAAGRLAATPEPSRRLIDATASRALWSLRGRETAARDHLERFLARYRTENRSRYTSHHLSETAESPLRVPAVPAVYSETSPSVDGRIVLQRCFAANFERDPRLFVIGEDVGLLGDVNLVFEGLQERFGDLRVTDTGIRETTILGQAIGAAIRGLRPIADIQYLDYVLFALQTASDDLATLRWRTAGGQKAPVIIRTKGHRLQGVWHTGSPLGTLVHALRGLHVAVPRDCVHAAGLYNTLLRGDDPAILIEVLNAYRLKERVPDNIGTFTVPLGRPELLRRGDDVTVVTYGACCRIATEAADLLAEMGVGVDVVDVQTLLPFDVDGMIARSVERTGAVVFLDEDVPGGATAYMMREVLEHQSAWWHLDAAPRTLTASATRCAYAADGEYYLKPSVEDVVRTAYGLARERDPHRLPAIDAE